MPSVDLAECTACDVRVDRVRVAVVEGVEGFEPKLQAHPFAKFYIFDQRDVPQLEPWS